MRIKRILLVGLSTFALMLSVFQVIAPANAQTSGITLDFAAAEPKTYDHASGGGKWNSGTVNVDIERSLEGEDFACGDRISYLTEITAADTTDLRELGSMSRDINYSFDLDTTGQSGLALAEPFTAELTTGDSANQNDGGSAVTTLETSSTGPIFNKGSEFLAKIRLTDLEAGETVVIRTTMTLRCKFGSSPSGNVQARLKDSFLTFIKGGTPVVPAEAISTGDKTVDLQKPAKVASPEVSISKTVTTQGGVCPGAEDITITPNQTVRYCYEVTNTSNSGGRLGAPLYNLSVIADDAGNIGLGFDVALKSGLIDIDKDGQKDDLAPGATATSYYELAFDGDKDSTIINVASIYGFDAPTDGNKISNSDTATVYVDAPEASPSISINKLTNGSDGSSILVGSTLDWTYEVENTGDVTLTSVTVVDDKGVTVTCPKTSLLAGEKMTCTASGVATIGNYANVATASGTYDTQTVSDTDGSSYFGASPSIEINKTPDNQTVKEGQKADFSVTVTNTGNVALTSISVIDPLSTGCNYTASDLTVSGTITYTCSSATLSAGFTNTATVTALWNSTPVEDSDIATVVVDFLPKINVTKEADKASVPESGGNVLFTVSVKNEGVESFTLNSLIDDKFGNLNGVGTCTTPQTISAGATFTCTFTKLLKSEVLAPHINIVTATGVDPEDNSASDSDDASVGFTDVLPDVALSKVANPTAVKWTGGLVDYTLTISNPGPETITITAFSDSKYPLSAECLALITQVLAPGASIQCTLQDVLVSGVAGGSSSNTATVTGADNEGNTDVATATATVNFWWYGRTPGYWKNHPEAWISGYQTNQFVQDVFAVPSSLYPDGTLNLDKTGGKDTLIAGLGYKGGSTLSGGAQILLRAAIAALLNEAYYGADFPVATSPTDLINQVNAVLLTANRSDYVTFGSYLDYWNNAVHAAIP